MRRASKSRNGCERCKKQRLKCDELKPGCGRCTRLGVNCPGYIKPALKWSKKHEVDVQAQVEPKHTASPSSKIPADVTQVIREPSSEHKRDGILRATSVSARTIFTTGLQNTLENPDVHSPTTLDAKSGEGEPILQPSFDVINDGLLLDNDGDFSTDFDTCFPELLNVFPILSSEETSFGYDDSALNQAFGFSSYEMQNGDIFTPTNTAPGLPLSYQTPHSPIESVRSNSSTSLVSFTPSWRRTPSIPSPTRPLNDTSTVLVEYYFKEVAGLFSSYDGPMNPFRTTVSKLWQASPAIYTTLQSMAAACLANDFPHLGREGIRLRREAMVLLEKETIFDDKSLLALLMLGQTASWHDPKDLGVSFFNKARQSLSSIEYGPAPLSRNDNNVQFFQEALIYWEMLLSYVTEGNVLVTEPPARQKCDIVSRQIPHPWTGFAKDAQFTVHEVGILIRKERIRIRNRRYTSQADIDQSNRAIAAAQGLEERLLELAQLGEPDVISPEDGDTPVWHLLRMAEVYRRTGLIQLYHAFPDLLLRRLPGKRLPGANFGNSAIRDQAVWLETASEAGDSSDDVESMRADWLTNFAMSTLDLLKSIPMESRTRCQQPFLLVASCSELRLPISKKSTSSSLSFFGEASRGGVELELSLRSIEIRRMRSFILSRLNSYLHVLPPRPIQVCLDLVRETWAKMDLPGGQHVFWVDIMIQNGFETTMG